MSEISTLIKEACSLMSALLACEDTQQMTFMRHRPSPNTESAEDFITLDFSTSRTESYKFLLFVSYLE
jgi:hypothetical protein